MRLQLVASRKARRFFNVSGVLIGGMFSCWCVAGPVASQCGGVVTSVVTVLGAAGTVRMADGAVGLPWMRMLLIVWVAVTGMWTAGSVGLPPGSMVICMEGVLMKWRRAETVVPRVVGVLAILMSWP